MRSSRQIFLWILNELSAGSGKARVGEKTPGHWAFTDRLLEWFPEAKFIHVHKDPRDVVASLRDQYWWVPKSALSSAMYCRTALEQLSLIGRRLGTVRFLDLRYETLMRHPEAELRRTCAFLGEDFQPGMLRFYERGQRGYLEVEEDRKGRA
jgi:hypothetical protein